MTTEQIDTSAIQKLLINAWSAEYALRITPLDPPKVEDSALTWTLPQAYYTTLFMVRAFLAARGKATDASHDKLIREGIYQEVDNLLDAGIYPEHGWRYQQTNLNFLRYLDRYRIQSADQLRSVVRTNLPAQHKALVADAARINHWHEQQIRNLIGPDTYDAIVEKAPLYLRTCLLEHRPIA